MLAFRPRIGLLAIALLAACGRDGESTRSPAPTAGSSTAFAGVVVDVHGTPVAKALVVAHDGDASLLAELEHPPPQTRSSDGGAFRFEQLAWRSLRVEVRADGYAPTEVDFASGAARDAVVLTLLRGGRIEGEVRLSDGGPDAGRAVELDRRFAEVRDRISIAFAPTVTDADGNFAFARVPPGDYEVSIETGDAELDVEPLAARVAVEDERVAHVVLQQPPLESVHVDGAVTANGAPLAFVRVEAKPAWGGREHSCATGADGRFDLVLPRPGRWNLALVPPDGAPTRRTLQVSAGEPNRFAIDLPTASLFGRVVDEDGAPCPEVWVDVETVAPFDFGERDLQYALVATDADGRFRIGSLQSGRHVVRVNTGVKRARWSEHAHAFAEVELARGAAGGVEIRLARSGNVSGVVRHADGTPAQASLFFVGDDGHADKGWSSDESGSFSLTRVAPGRLRLFARTPTSVSAWSEPVEVESGASASVDLVLQPAATLSIELSSGGVRPDEARVDVRDADGRDMSAFEDSAIAGCLSVAKGRATIGPLPSGRYTLRAGDSSQRRATAELSIAGDGPQRVALELTR